MKQPTEFFLDPDDLAEKFAKNLSYYNSKNEDDYHTAFFRITDKFLKQAPLNYLKFGPYWWAIKQILHNQGFSGYVGEPDLLAQFYRYQDENGKTNPYTTLTAGWLFKDYYNANFFQGNRQFALWGDQDIYELFDPYWEFQFA